MLQDIGFGNDLFDMTSKVQVTKAKTTNEATSNLKITVREKETINKVKRQLTECEKIPANHISNNGLIEFILKIQ